MADKPGLLKRLFRFGKKAETPVEEKAPSVEEAVTPDAPVAEPVTITPVEQPVEPALVPDPGAPEPREPEPVASKPAKKKPVRKKQAKAAPVQDGVFHAPGETSTHDAVSTPEPLADTPEPPPVPEREDDDEVAETDFTFAAEPPVPLQEAVQAEGDGAAKSSWFARLRHGLSRSSTSLTEGITAVFTKSKLDEDTLQDLEDVLIQADLGMETAVAITDELASQRMGKDVTDEDVRTLMADEIERVLDPVAGELELDLDHTPHVILVVGVNGSGKTTTIGKLSQKLYDAGFSTLLVAGDTFRAAAIEQLKIWGDRTLSPVVSRPLGSDAAGLAFDAYSQCVEENRDVMLMDTAGRLQNKKELMAELEKIIRVLRKQDPTAPHTVLLTLDATTGQNALNQVDIFRDVAGVNGLVMTKLDGTARGGILVSISARHKLPVYFIGVGETVDDLEPFEARDFARTIAGLAG